MPPAILPGAMTTDPEVTGERPLLVRAGWTGLGCAAIGVGGVGIVVPGLPTTVFFIIAAWAFAKSSPRLEAWVLDLRTIGPAVRDYRDGVGMPKQAKVIAATMIVAFVSLSAWLVDGWVLRSGILIAGVVGLLVVLVHVPTKPPEGRHP